MTKITSKTDPQKRKKMNHHQGSAKKNKILSSSSEDEEDDLFYLVDFKKTRHVSIVASKNLIKTNDKEGRCKHLGIYYEVSILCMGTEMRCLEKKDKYSEKLSLSSTEDESILVKNCKLYFDSLRVIDWHLIIHEILNVVDQSAAISQKSQAIKPIENEDCPEIDRSAKFSDRASTTQTDIDQPSFISRTEFQVFFYYFFFAMF
jgi:hypothetical protein